MKFKFKVQPHQTEAVDNVVDCFAGQPFISQLDYKFADQADRERLHFDFLDRTFMNAEVVLNNATLLSNIHAVQRRQELPLSPSLTTFTVMSGNNEAVPATPAYIKSALDASHIHLDVEMETGTGKTYCYLKTIFEMNKRYGWSKFIIMVPSIAIREGVYTSLKDTAEHFAESYAKKTRFFLYNSKRLQELESFSSDAGINIMIINIQAFNARGADNRRIYEELDSFQSRKPIDVIASTRPILILDEPQKMEGAATMESLPKFKPLFVLRYSATHRTQHNRIHRLDALDAYNQKLVKKIAVRGVQMLGLSGTQGYAYLEGINISTKAPVARMEIETRKKDGSIQRIMRKINAGDDLHKLSAGLNAYKGWVVSNIDARRNAVDFRNGVVLETGQAYGDVTEEDIRRIQIRETIQSHLDKERTLFAKGIKTLSLFFIDEVAKYREYGAADEKGPYAHVFEESYAELVSEVLGELDDHDPYKAYLKGISASRTHKGYFSIDKKTNRLVNPNTLKSTGESDDTDAYELILKDKGRLLSFAEPTRFLFSHSALREGWDNPNVFGLCMLKHSDNTVSRRQEIGRGLRLCVDQDGNRFDDPVTTHDINVLTVIANESYTAFVEGLQTEMAKVLSGRTRHVDADVLQTQTIFVDGHKHTITKQEANLIYKYLAKNDFVSDKDTLTDVYVKTRAAGTMPLLPDVLLPLQAQIFAMLDKFMVASSLPTPSKENNKKTVKPNRNIEKAEFLELWNRISRKATYRVDFESDALVQRAKKAIDEHLNITPLQYVVTRAVQKDVLATDDIDQGKAFKVVEESKPILGTRKHTATYDLVGKVAEQADLTRRTAAKILSEIAPATFQQFSQNPEAFIARCGKLIQDEKVRLVVERLTYDPTTERYDLGVLMTDQRFEDSTRVVSGLNKHVYDHVVVDSDVEREFANSIDVQANVAVYAKLPKGFQIPTPIGPYNPDWAIAFDHQEKRHVYFVAETKGSSDDMDLRTKEQMKIACAKRFFESIAPVGSGRDVRYGVVKDKKELQTLLLSMQPKNP